MEPLIWYQLNRKCILYTSLFQWFYALYEWRHSRMTSSERCIRICLLCLWFWDGVTIIQHFNMEQGGVKNTFSMKLPFCSLSTNELLKWGVMSFFRSRLLLIFSCFCHGESLKIESKLHIQGIYLRWVFLKVRWWVSWLDWTQQWLFGSLS